MVHQPNYQSLFTRVQQSALKQTIQNVTEKSLQRVASKASASRFRQNMTANVNSGFFESNKTTAAGPHTNEKRGIGSKTTFDSAANRTLVKSGLDQKSEPDIIDRTVASLRNTCIAGVRSSGFFGDNTLPVNVCYDRHAKSTLMGKKRDSVTPIVKHKLHFGGPQRLNSVSRNDHYII